MHLTDPGVELGSLALQVDSLPIVLSGKPPDDVITNSFPFWQEGKDKMFRIDKLIKLQGMEKRANPTLFTLERRDLEVRLQAALGSL